MRISPIKLVLTTSLRAKKNFSSRHSRSSKLATFSRMSVANVSSDCLRIVPRSTDGYGSISRHVFVAAETSWRRRTSSPTTGGMWKPDLPGCGRRFPQLNIRSRTASRVVKPTPTSPPITTVRRTRSRFAQAGGVLALQRYVDLTVDRLRRFFLGGRRFFRLRSTGGLAFFDRRACALRNWW